MSKQENKKTTVLVSVLIGLLIAFLLQYDPFIDFFGDFYNKKLTSNILEGENEIFAIKTKEVKPSSAYLEIDYFYNGIRPEKIDPYLIAHVTSNNLEDLVNIKYVKSEIKKGRHTAIVEVARKRKAKAKHTTTKLRVYMRSINKILANKELGYEIEWPVFTELTEEEKYQLKNYLKFAIRANDKGTKGEIRAAKDKLEESIIIDPNFIEAYHELARAYMKLNWNPDGLKKAENVLSRALEIDSNYADGHVLMGYVYAHTDRHTDALASFEKAEKLKTDNLWLYANWGEVYLMKGDLDESLKYYMKVVANPRRSDLNDRAIHDAYLKIIMIYKQRNDWDRVENTYQELATKFHGNTCSTYEYAEFLLYVRQKYDQAINILKDLSQQNCRSINTIKTLMSAVYIAKWAQESDKNSKNAVNLKRDAETLQNDVSIILAILARTNNHVEVFEAIKAAGLSIDDRNEKGITPLAYAVSSNDEVAVKNLINMGAKVNQPGNEEQWSPLMIAVLSNNEKIVKILLDNGADPNYESKSGLSVHKLLKGIENPSIKKLLDRTEI